jgi:hypothetical protein
MAKKPQKDRLEQWQQKVVAADKSWKKWAAKYRIDRIEPFYHGFQWEQLVDDLNDEQSKYVINLFFGAIETKRPSLLFYHPHYSVSARPTRQKDIASNAEGRAQLRADLLNTFVGDATLHFREKTSLSLLEALFTYGIIEVGYTADFIDNPQAGKPILDEDKEEIAKQPEVSLSSEWLFLKRIPAKTFRVSMNPKNLLAENDWCGYYEWHYPADLRANKAYSNTSSLKGSASLSPELQSLEDGMLGGSEKADEAQHDKGMVKVWKVWDMRAKTRLVFAEGAKGFLLEKPFKFLPFADLKFLHILDEYYPFPLTHNWTWPQMEENDIRESERIHRQRFKRRFVRTPSLTVEEASKLANGDDGTIVEAAMLDCIKPIEDAPLDSAVRISAAEVKVDFNEITGVTAEMRGIAESETATQSNILDTRARIRESFERVEVGAWLSEIGRLILMTVQEYMALPFWVKTVVDPLSPQAPLLAREVEAVWKEITTEDLGDMDYDVSVDIESLSPSTEQQQQQAWNNFLAQVMSNPMLLQLMALSPTILRRTAHLNGIKSAKDLMALEQAIPQLVASLAAAAAQQQAAKGGGVAGEAAPGEMPQLQEIMGQLQSQVPQ